MTLIHFCCKPPHNYSTQKHFLLSAYQEFLQNTLSVTFVGTVETSLSTLNVDLHDLKYRRTKNNTERGRGAKGCRVGVFITVSQLIMSGSVGPLTVPKNTLHTIVTVLLYPNEEKSVATQIIIRVKILTHSISRCES